MKDLFVGEPTDCVCLKSTGKFYRMRRGNRLPPLLCTALFLFLLLASQRTFTSQSNNSQTNSAQPNTSQPTTLPDLPSATDTLQYLRQTIDWYQHLRVEEQLATG